MRTFPRVDSTQPKVCAACGSSYPRQDCHKNRYGEYFCQGCRAAGLKSTPRGKLRHTTRRTAARLWLGLTFATLLGMLAWGFYVLFFDFGLRLFFQVLFA